MNDMKPKLLRRLALIVFVAAIEASPVQATNLGISYTSTNGEMPAALSTAIKQYANEEGQEGRLHARVTDAQNDPLREIEGVQNFIAARVDAIIVAPVDSNSTQKITTMADQAGIPLVLLDASFNERVSQRGVSTVGSGDSRPGVVQMREVCRLIGGEGNVVVLMDDPAKSDSRERMHEIEEVASKAPCNHIKIIDRRQGGSNPLQNADVAAAWFRRGVAIDAVVAQSDELALGAIRALKKSKRTDKVIVAGIGATPAGLAAVEAGDMTITVFQNEFEQGRAAIDLAVQMTNAPIFHSNRSIPASVVTKNNCASYRQVSSGSVLSGHPRRARLAEQANTPVWNRK